MRDTGIGLTVSRRLVEMMGGTLSAESEGGRGSAFRALVAKGCPPAATSGGADAR